MWKKTQDRNPDDFWREYEEKTGEKILAHALGLYISGWDEFDRNGWNDIWGLIIISSGGFRFHHFPQQNWLRALSMFDDSGKSREKIIFIPKEKIVSAKLQTETRWWAKLLTASPPVLTVQCRDDTDNEKQLRLKVEFGFKELAEKLDELNLVQDKAATAAPNRDACSTGAII